MGRPCITYAGYLPSDKVAPKNDLILEILIE